MTLASGSQLGPYEIVAPLGAGGMGEIYRAKDTRLDREVAVKVLPEHLAKDREALSRFEREAKAVAALSHPNILAIHDVGTEGETSYVVMELLEGETLRERVRRSPVPWRKAVEIGVAIADGLAAAHAKGIVHRDLKPENVFLTTDGVVKILDFGLARIDPGSLGTPPEEQADTPTVTLDTRPGTVLGTVNYMSPEQVRGQKIDARSDIFSFGSVLYEMMTGSRAFTGESTPETMTAILKEDPPGVVSTRAEVIPEVDRVITRCVEKKPEHRIQSARDLAFALRDILMDSGPSKPVMATPTPKAARLSWILVGALAVALAVVLTLWQAGKLGSDKGEAITSLAVLPFVSVGGDPETEYLSDEIPASIINNLARLSDLRVVPRGTAFRHKGREKELATLGRELRVEAILTGRVAVFADSLIIHAELIDVANDKQLWGTKYRRTLADILTIEEDIAKQISDALRLRLTYEDKARLTERYTDNAEAYRAYLQGRFWWHKASQEGWSKAIEHFQRAIDIDPEYALAYAGLADTLGGLASWNAVRPLEVATRAKLAADTAYRLDDSLAEVHTSLGWVAMTFEWDWLRAERAFKRAIELNPDYEYAHHLYAHLLTVRGRDDEAIARYQRAVQAEPVSPHNRACFGSHYLAMGRLDDAERQLRLALEWDSEYVPALWYLGSVQQQRGQHEEAVATFELACRIAQNSPVKAALASAYAMAGRTENARRLLGELHAVAKTRYVGATEFARIHAGLGEKDQAFRWLDKALNERESWLPWAQFEPGFENLRGDSRFNDLLRRMGVVPVASRVGDTGEHATQKTTLAVLPFEPASANPDTEYLKGEIPASIIHTLSALSDLQVIPRSTAFRCKIDDRDTASIGRDLNATAVLTGQINTRGNSLRIRAELVDVATNRQLWSERYDRTLTDILAIERDIAESISETLKLRLTGEERTQLAKRSTANPEAHRFYLEGRFWWNRRSERGLRKAIEFFDEAIQIDPTYALAYAGKADCYWMLAVYFRPPNEVVPKAVQALDTALRIDDTLAEAYAPLGLIKCFYDWDWAGAEEALQKAIQLNPRYATAHQWYAHILSATGRHHGAIRASERARELDPGSLIINSDLASHYYIAREFDRAIEQSQRTLDMYPGFVPAHVWLGLTLLAKQQYDEAIATFRAVPEPARRFPKAAGFLGHTYALAGRRDEAIEELETLRDVSKDQYVPAIAFAMIHAGLGDMNRSFEWIERAVEDREPLLPYFKVVPLFDSLRDDPRFDDLLRRIGLPP